MVGGQISHCRWPFLILGQNNGKKIHCLEIFSNFSRENLVSFLSRLEIFDYLNVSNCLDTHLKIYKFSWFVSMHTSWVSICLKWSKFEFQLSRSVSIFVSFFNNFSFSSRLDKNLSRPIPNLELQLEQNMVKCNGWFFILIIKQLLSNQNLQPYQNGFIRTISNERCGYFSIKIKLSIKNEMTHSFVLQNVQEKLTCSNKSL